MNRKGFPGKGSVPAHGWTRPAFLGFAVVLFLIILIGSSPSAAEENLSQVQGIKHWSLSDTFRLAVDLSGPVSSTQGRLSNPDRIFVDIRGAKLKKGIPTTIPVQDTLVRSVRIGQNTGSSVRIVFDLAAPDTVLKITLIEDPYRLVMELTGKKAPSEPKNDPSNALSTKRIVIDPGHGGTDPGAVGPNGLYEKDVVLDVALRVKNFMRKNHPGYEIILTRDTDIFIPLENRAAIANKNKADLFVSIHANASTNKSARGVETYLLNWSNDIEAMKVAARENAVSLKKMKQLQNELSVILASLERESKRDESVKLASYIQTSIVSSLTPRYPKVHNLGVKQALFYVLVGAKMPSVLVEVSFISNRDEEKLLSTADYKQKIALSIVEGIIAYGGTPSMVNTARVKNRQEKKPNIKPISYRTN